MREIGGYFELADREHGCGFPHSKGIMLNTARNALEYILKTESNVQKVYLPLYTCDVVLEPLSRLSIPYEFYNINERFEIAQSIQIGDSEYLIANNYFGIKDAYIKILAERFEGKIIIDNAQAFFAKHIDGTAALYSCRKFIGVADGGIAYCKAVEGPEEQDCSTNDHDQHLEIRRIHGAEAGFRQYRENEKKLCNKPAMRMSAKTFDILMNIDYTKIIMARKRNFDYLHNALKDINGIVMPPTDSFECPMVYPFVPSHEGIREKLIDNKVFCARYWPNILDWAQSDSIEYNLASNLIAIPCDQRYEDEDMDRIIKLIIN